MNDLASIPIGSRVLVQIPGHRPYLALVGGYDDSRTKYHLRPEHTVGTYTSKSIAWAFLNQVTPI